MDKRRLVNKLRRIQIRIENTHPVDYDAVRVVDTLRRKYEQMGWFEYCKETKNENPQEKPGEIS